MAVKYPAQPAQAIQAASQMPAGGGTVQSPLLQQMLVQAIMQSQIDPSQTPMMPMPGGGYHYGLPQAVHDVNKQVAAKHQRKQLEEQMKQEQEASQQRYMQGLEAALRLAGGGVAGQGEGGLSQSDMNIMMMAQSGDPQAKAIVDALMQQRFNPQKEMFTEPVLSRLSQEGVAGLFNPHQPRIRGGLQVGGQYTTETDPEGRLIQRNILTGQAEAVDKAPKTVVNVGTGEKAANAFIEQHSKNTANYLAELQKDSDVKAESFEKMSELRNLFEQGIRTGALEDWWRNMAAIGDRLGLLSEKDKAELGRSQNYNAVLNAMIVRMIQISGGARGWTDFESSTLLKPSYPEAKKTPEALAGLMLGMERHREREVYRQNKLDSLSDELTRATMMEDRQGAADILVQMNRVRKMNANTLSREIGQVEKVSPEDIQNYLANNVRNSPQFLERQRQEQAEGGQGTAPRVRRPAISFGGN